MPKSRSKRQLKQPPPRPRPKQSPEWVGILFFVLLGAGAVVIIGNYLGLFGGAASNWRLFYGLGLVSASFLVATQWH
ncbi:MAG TPA: cell division protein CrgA [Actinomycetota bacterium]|nr:cell division protein CrgA [Actinomycetota bacterium]